MKPHKSPQKHILVQWMMGKIKRQPARETQNTLLHGFDVRVKDLQRTFTLLDSPDWNLRLRPDIRGFLSVNRSTWPSIFADDYFAETQLIFKMGLGPPTRPSSAISNQAYCPDAAELFEYLEQCKISLDDVIVIKVDQVDTSLGFEPDHAYESLGYDVACEMHYSGLTNFGWSESELQQLRSEYGSKVNQWHLFSHQEDAKRFAAVCDQLVEEHSPFFVFHISLVHPKTLDDQIT